MATIRANGEKVFEARKASTRYVLCSNGVVLRARWNNEGFHKVNTLKSMNLITYGDFADMLGGLEYAITWEGFRPDQCPTPKKRRRW